MLPFLLACAEPVQVDADSWPSVGCSSTGAPEWGDAPLLPEEHVLEHDGRAVVVRALVPAGPGCHPAVLLVPPGFDEGLPELDELASHNLARAGLVVVAFDPSGRGESPGDEDHGGPRQQDDLAAVLAWLAQRPDVDTDRIVVRSRSLGIAMASGALARHPELQPMALYDIEGPASLPDNLDYATERTRETFYAAAEGDDWWAERSPDLLLGHWSGRYRRVQALDDHALGSFLGHAQELLNVASAAGGEVDYNGVPGEIWSYEDVEDGALDGRVKHDDRRAMDLLLDLYDERGG